MTLHDFSDGSDGAYPLNGIIEGPDGWFYGVADFGTIFKINSAGTFTTLYQLENQWPLDGYEPYTLVKLVIGNDGNLYGAAPRWGQSQAGFLFKISLDDGTFSTIYDFTAGQDGGRPVGIVQGLDGYFYGSTQSGDQAAWEQFTGCQFRWPIQLTQSRASTMRGMAYLSASRPSMVLEHIK